MKLACSGCAEPISSAAARAWWAEVRMTATLDTITVTCRFGRRPWLATLLLSGLLLSLVVAQATAQCTGDCDQSLSVTVDEVVTGVNIALGTRDLGSCTSFDADNSQSVTVDEIIQALNFALTGCTAASPTPLRTATPVATPTPAGGPQITFFGLANASGVEIAQAGQSDGIPVYQPASRIGFGFLLVVEAKRGTDGTELGNSNFRSDPFSPSLRPDLQIQANQPLGNGSTAICDRRSNPPESDPGGGVPAISPPSFDLGSQSIADALNDFACRFRFYFSTDPCTTSALGNPRTLRTDSEAQFCTEDVVSAYWGFPSGDTLLTVRWADAKGVLSAPKQLILRVPPR